MTYSTNRRKDAPPEKPRRTGWTVFWLVLVVIAFVGQTAALYIPAIVGIAPNEGNPTQLPGRILGAFLWPILLSVLIQKVRNKRKLIGALFGLTIGFLIYSGAFYVAGKNSSKRTDSTSRGDVETRIGEVSSAWIQSELTDEYMRQRTKDECMLKTISFLESCNTPNCLNTMAGVMGDCVTWADGDLREFCATYEQSYVTANCTSGGLSKQACAVLNSGKNVFCEAQ